MDKILQTTFIKRYCKNSGIAEKELNPLGLFAVPCDCGEEDCDGWAMITRENLKAHCDLDIELRELETTNNNSNSLLPSRIPSPEIIES